MKKAIQKLGTDFAAAAAIQTIVGDACYAIAVPQDLDKDNFIVYTVSERQRETKDGVFVYDVRIGVSHKILGTLIDHHEVVRDHGEGTMDMDYTGSTEVQQTQDQYYQVDVNFEITI